MSLIEDRIPAGEHERMMAEIYRRMMAALEAFEVYSNQIYQIEPSEN